MSKVYTVVTKSDSTYTLDFGDMTWERRSNYHDDIVDGGVITGFAVGDRKLDPNFSEWPQVTAPEVGLSMFIHGDGFYDWVLSTRVTEIVKEFSWE